VAPVRATRAKGATSGDARGATANGCICAGCKAGLAPFTLKHFVAWSSDLILDNDERWTLEPFQLEFIDDLFAGRPENWLILPEGQGKTTLIAGVVLHHLEHRIMGKVPVAASSRDQAEILYGQMKSFVRRTPRLHRLFNGKPVIRCFDGYREVEHFVTESTSKVYAADDKTADGVIFTLAIIEELHRHKDLRLYRTWTGKARKRKGAQVVTISTAGEPYSDFEDTRERIRQLPGAKRRGSFVRACSAQIVIHDWSVPPKADITDMRVVKQANPFSGITTESLQQDFDSPTMTLAHFSRFKGNLATRAISSAINDSEWSRALSKEKIPEGEPIWIGIDIGRVWDTTAIVPLWPRDAGFRLIGPAKILTPPRISGERLSSDEIHRAILELHERNPIHTAVIDPFDASDTIEWLTDTIGCEVIEWTNRDESQTDDYEQWMTGLRVGWLKHSGDRGLTRHVFNAVARMLPNGKTRFDRAKSSRQGGDNDARVIDALVAAAMVNAKVAEEFGEDGGDAWVAS